MTKAFCYLRVSGKSQCADDRDGFPRQLEAVQSYALAHDLEIVQTYKDEGVSGANELADRPALLRLIADMEANGVRMVIIERVDRLARDMIVQETIIKQFQKLDCTVISTLEPDLCVNDPSRVLIRRIFGAIAEYDREMITAKMNAAKLRIRARGERCEGRKPYGSRPGETETVERIKELRAEGASLNDIRKMLNSEGRKPRKSGEWQISSIRLILSR